MLHDVARMQKEHPPKSNCTKTRAIVFFTICFEVKVFVITKGQTQTRFAVRSLKHRLGSQAFLVKPVVSTRCLFHKKAVCPGKGFQ